MDTVVPIPIHTVIQFIGLFVFTTLTTGGNATGRTALLAANPSRSVIVAIAPSVIGDPRLQRSTSTASQKNTLAQATKATTVSTSHGDFVEAHTTMITFRLSDLESPVVGWNKTRLKPNGGPNDDWYYVELSGEQVTFVADSPNDDIDVTSLQTLPLRHLHHTLMSVYMPSGSYKKAAAVFTIPKGTLSACSYNISPDGNPARIDTKLTLHTIKTLTILGTGNKSITLSAGAPIFIGNVPLAFAKTGEPTTKAHEHYKVYCEMVGDTTCMWPPALESAQGSDPDPCNDGLPYRQRAGHPEAPTLPRFVLDTTQASDYACSNTQWP
ncbi:MAG: hypothetical protein QOE82_2185 [Thermoanaerobaculia bacterium]|jgi:hypothetical protein|nr:hypothetical protein [Thermoanaerobaculia bacterium]